jgi:hypothetical protein
MDKVQIIEGSLRCFWRSVCSLVPILGLPFAVHSIFIVRRIRRATRGGWNPAERYVNGAAVLGWIGIGLTVVTCVVITLIVIHNFLPGGSTYETFGGAGGD